MLSQFRPHQGKTLPNDPNVPIIRESKDGNSILALKTAISTIHVVFPDIEASAKESLIRVVESCSQVAENDGSTSVSIITFDHLFNSNHVLSFFVFLYISFPFFLLFFFFLCS